MITGFLVVCAIFYFLPAVIAAIRGVNRLGSVFVLNLLLGWTLIGWVAALVMAMSMETSGEYELRMRSYSYAPTSANAVGQRGAGFNRLWYIGIPACLLTAALVWVSFKDINFSGNEDNISDFSIPTPDMPAQKLEKLWSHYHSICKVQESEADDDGSCANEEKAAYFLEKNHNLCWGPKSGPESVKAFMPCGAQTNSLVPDDFHL